MTGRTGQLVPRYRIAVDGQDITRRLMPRLNELSIESTRADHADQLNLSFSDTDGRVALPRRGVTVEVMLGFDGTGVGLQGTYTVDEVEHTGPPDVIRVRARSAQMASPLCTRKERSWNSTTVGEVVTSIAGENGLTPRVSGELASIEVGHIDQTESDMALLRRLGKLWDAIATVKAGCLIFSPIGKRESSGGRALPAVTLVRMDGDRHHFQEADRDAYTGVRARWYDMAAARGRTVIAGTSQHLKVLQRDFADETDARRAAEAELARIKRGASTFELDLAYGRPDIHPETPITLRGWKPDIEAVEWIVDKAAHTLSGTGGYTSRLELQNRAASSDAPAVPETDDHVDDNL